MPRAYDYDNVLLTMAQAGRAFDTTTADVQTLVDLGYIETIDINGEPMVRIGDVPSLEQVIIPVERRERRLPIQYQFAS